MAFTTQRGRPRKSLIDHDFGTPELRLKHALRLTAEPIDLCLEKRFITEEQHWCGLHLRWLYTLRYGAPSLTSFYADTELPASAAKKPDAEWRMMREREYHEAVNLLKTKRRYECVMRLAVFNERPVFLTKIIQQKAHEQYAVSHEVKRLHLQLCEGLDLLASQWRRAQK